MYKPTIEELDKQVFAKVLFTIVAEEFRAVIEPWKQNEHCVGLWDYTNVQILGIDIRVGASGGGVISLNGHPFDPDGKVIDNADSLRKAIKKVVDI